MAINLIDIRDAVVDYLATVPTVVSKPVADVPEAISPDEGFSFDVTVTNKDIQLSEVVYHVLLDSDDGDNDADKKEAALIVPKSPPARASNDANAALLNEGDLVKEMFLFKRDNTLEPTESDTLHLTGKALSLGTVEISAHVHAQVAADWLLAPANTSAPGSHSFDIV